MSGEAYYPIRTVICFYWIWQRLSDYYNAYVSQKAIGNLLWHSCSYSEWVWILSHLTSVLVAVGGTEESLTTIECWAHVTPLEIHNSCIVFISPKRWTYWINVSTHSPPAAIEKGFYSYCQYLQLKAIDLISTYSWYQTEFVKDCSLKVLSSQWRRYGVTDVLNVTNSIEWWLVKRQF